jgi:hypothetical protein
MTPSSSKLTSPAASPSSNGKNGATALTSDGLETLARAAAIFSSTITPCSPAHHSEQIEPVSFTSEHTSPALALSPSRQPPTPAPTSPLVLDLPPLLFPELSRPTTVLPPFSTFSTLAGSGCTCGLTCQCPDCPSHSNTKPGAGGDCMNCVDQSLRVIDRTGDWKFPSPALEKFFAVAERVPPPPVAGGKVEIPKLCCAGSCGCAGACGCGGDCNGCCEDFGKEAPEDAPDGSIALPMAPSAGSCCITP